MEEFASVVAIEPEQGEGERRFDIFDLFQDTPFTPAPDGPLFGPAGGDIDAVDGKGEHSHHGFSAMGHGIGFEEPWSGFVPRVGLNRDLSLQKGSGFCRGAAPFAVLDSAAAEHPVEGGRRDGQQRLAHLLGKRSNVLEIPRQPQRQEGGQPFRTGQVCGQPDLFQGFEEFLLVVYGGFASFPGPGFCEAPEASKHPYRLFAMTAAGGAVFIRNLRFLSARSSLVT